MAERASASIKITPELHRWLKLQAVIAKISLYEMIETLIAQSPEGEGRPWARVEQNRTAQ